MSFRLPKGLRDFFDYQEQRMYARTDRLMGDEPMILFDGFYASLIIGTMHTGIGNADDLDAQPFITEGYPSSYSGSREFIAALVVDAELRRLGTDDYEQADFEREISKLLKVDSPTGLSAEGLELANLYAAGGYRLIEEKLQPQPRSAADFFLRFHTLCVDEGIFSD